jgi:hypothetical protein
LEGRERLVVDDLLETIDEVELVTILQARLIIVELAV